MRIVMIGPGYVGLVSGACLADFAEVVCVEVDEGARISSRLRWPGVRGEG
jgi:UDP-glucose 6-dehydrogenase